MDLEKSGPKSHILEIIKWWEKAGHVITLFVPRLSQPTAPKKNSNTIFIPTVDISSIKIIIYQIMLVFYLCAYFFKNNRKLELIYDRLYILPIVPILFARIFRINHVIELNGVIREEMAMNNNSKVQIAISTLLQRFNYRYTDKIICVTEGIKRDLIDYFKVDEKKIHVVSNGVDTNMFRPVSSDFVLRKYGIKKNQLLVGFVGVFFKWQGLNNLINSIPLVIDKYQNVKFIIVGDGKEYNNLINLSRRLGVKNKVVFTGNVSHDEIPYYINSFDICVAPFTRGRNVKTGLSPIKLYEYLSCGKPVVVSDIPGLKECVDTGNCGVVVEPDNSVELSKAIYRLLIDTKLRKKMGKNARKLAEHNYSWERIARRVMRVIGLR